MDFILHEIGTLTLIVFSSRQIDTTLSLLGFAVTINSAILILASAAFYYGGNEAIRQAGADADLFSAHDLIKQQISKGMSWLLAIPSLSLAEGLEHCIAAAFIFALALLCVCRSCKPLPEFIN